MYLQNYVEIIKNKLPKILPKAFLESPSQKLQNNLGGRGIELFSSSIKSLCFSTFILGASLLFNDSPHIHLAFLRYSLVSSMYSVMFLCFPLVFHGVSWSPMALQSFLWFSIISVRFILFALVSFLTQQQTNGNALETVKNIAKEAMRSAEK